MALSGFKLDDSNSKTWADRMQNSYHLEFGNFRAMSLDAFIVAEILKRFPGKEKEVLLSLHPAIRQSAVMSTYIANFLPKGVHSKPEFRVDPSKPDMVELLPTWAACNGIISIGCNPITIRTRTNSNCFVYMDLAYRDKQAPIASIQADKVARSQIPEERIFFAALHNREGFTEVRYDHDLVQDHIQY